jgi:hypothetical protein
VKTILLLGSILGVAFLAACGEDENPVIPPPGGSPEYENLTEREHVINNLELSCNDRNLSRYDELVDDNFTFHFSPGDVGGTIPAQWGRTDEMAAATGLFCRTGCDPGVPLCRSIRMDVKFEDGVTWDAVVPLSTPTETWYTTTVFYEFTVEIEPDVTYIAVPGARAQFTVRNAGTDESPQWRLVEWRDLGDGAIVVQGPASTEASTWGSIKALYR